MKYVSILLAVLSFGLFSCSQGATFGPGYRWELFKDTPNWALAEAVSNQDTEQIEKLVKTGKFDINLQEPAFGRTLLLLAVGNDKEKSVEALLKAGANVHLKDSSDYQAIHEATSFIESKKHTYAILKMLLMYGADANALSDKGYYSVPLEGAVSSLTNAKLLLDNGATPYYRLDSTYVVWKELLLEDLSDNIFNACYFIVDRKLLIPNPIMYTFPDREPLDIFTLLKKADYSNNLKKQRAKEEIIKYLSEINFPNNGVYKE